MRKVARFVAAQITGVSVTPGSDQLCIIHLQGGNDLVLCLQPSPPGGDKIGEVIGALSNIWLTYVFQLYMCVLRFMISSVS